MTPKTAEDRLRYAKQYASVLTTTSYGIPKDLLQLSPNKRIHVMKALSCLAKYTGMQDHWLAIRKRYGLQWSTGTEKIDAFTRFFDNTRSLDTMLHWLHEAIEALPVAYSRFLIFCTLTGLRGSEAIESVKLLLNGTNSCSIALEQARKRQTYYYNPEQQESVRLLNDCREVTPSSKSHQMTSGYSKSSSSSIQHPSLSGYYNPEQQILEHYRFPDIFIRRTKAIYISVVDDSTVEIARKIQNNTLTLNGLKMQIRHRKLSFRVNYCRKIYASYLHRCGISSEFRPN